MADSEAPAASPRRTESRSSDEQQSATPPEASQGEQQENTTSTSPKPTSSEGSQPPLPDEEVPPLPDEPLPSSTGPTAEDDGWAPIWDPTHQAFYFYNRFTQASQWENPRVPSASSVPAISPVPASASAAATNHDRIASSASPSLDGSSGVVAGGYNPAIHGSYDPTAPYAQPRSPSPPALNPLTHPLAPGVADAAAADAYAATATFNRFTGRFQRADLNPENYNDEAKSRRQMAAFFDVDAMAETHDGRSLKAERQGKKLSKKEVKAFREKRREKKEEKRRAWLRD